MKRVDKVFGKNAKCLSEHESKKLLAEYGVEVTEERLVTTEDEAVTVAANIGYPVALKASGEEFSHKTELGLIELNLKNIEDVRMAFKRLTSRKDVSVQDVLVQQMVEGDRELVVGLTRDPQFGPCVMFGLGGVLTEILEDVTFRVAPLSKRDALDMIKDIRANKILNAFRGKPPVDRNALADILIAVGRIGLEVDKVKEIDINPLKIRNGRPVAVDALVVLEDESKR
jgi:acetyl-CoA synthetase (ADP-forming)